MKNLTTIALLVSLHSIIFSNVNAQLLKKTPEKIDKKIVRATESFLTMQISEDKKIPTAALKAAKGIVIINEVKAGFIVGAEGGGGVAMVRGADGEWSPPGFVVAGSTSYGLQIGAEQVDIVLLLMTDEALGILKNGTAELGLDITATAGRRDGIAIEASSLTNTPILVYANSGGLYAGASLKGGGIIPAEKRNEIYYGRSFENVLFKPGVKPTSSGIKLIDAVNKYSK